MASRASREHGLSVRRLGGSLTARSQWKGDRSKCGARPQQRRSATGRTSEPTGGSHIDSHDRHLSSTAFSQLVGWSRYTVT